MHILLQKNIWKEHGYERLIQSIIDIGSERKPPYLVTYQEVHVSPFTTEFDEPVTKVPDLVFGSGRFINICRDLGYPTLQSFKPIELNLFQRRFWINGEGDAHTWGELKITEPTFIKPFTEKFFTGCVVEDQSDLDKVQLATSFIGDEKDELVWACPIVNIAKEVRFFIAKGCVITASVYREKRTSQALQNFTRA